MAYVNYARVAAGRSYGKSSSVKLVTKDISSVPWEQFFEAYQTAADEWEELATQAHEQGARDAYDVFLQKAVEQWEEANPEAGAYEGNMADEQPMNPISLLPGKVKGRRKAGQKALVAAIEALNLGDWSESILPQVITLFGNMPVKRNENGLISGKSFLADNITTNKLRGMYVVLMLDSRSCFLSTQYKLPAKQFSALVPLIMYAQRLIKGTKYTEWDPEGINWVVNNDLAEAMQFRAEDWPSNDDLLDGRVKGLTFASGVNAGKVRNPISTFRLYATTDTCYQGMPACAQVMLSQIWVAHPDNRTKYMVLDPRQWDRVPPALVAQDVLAPAGKPVAFIKEERATADWL